MCEVVKIKSPYTTCMMHVYTRKNADASGYQLVRGCSEQVAAMLCCTCHQGY